MRTKLEFNWWFSGSGEIPEIHQIELEQHALERATEMRKECYICGELCHTIDGIEYRGVWEFYDKNRPEKRLNRIPKDNPKIIVTISNGCFQYACANTEIDLVIEDLDDIEFGGELYYPCLSGSTKEEFEEKMAKAEINCQEVINS